MTSQRQSPRFASRVAASLLGGWAFTWGFVTLGIALLLRAGMTYADARSLVHLLAFIVFLAALCGSFVGRSVMHVWLALLGGGGAMTALAFWLLRPQT